jgi:hypothetical protein
MRSEPRWEGGWAQVSRPLNLGVPHVSHFSRDGALDTSNCALNQLLDVLRDPVKDSREAEFVTVR